MADKPVDQEEFDKLRKELRDELEGLRKQLGETLEELIHLKDHFVRVFPPPEEEED
jgi:hypothetical protein